MNVNENNKIVYLAGPSSSGKTTSTRLLQETGWMRIEADVERPQIDIRFLRLKPNLFEKIAYIESHLAEPTDENVLETLHGKPPDKILTNPEQFHSVCKELIEFLDSKRQDIGPALLIHMLDKAIEIAKQGKNVIIDNVPLINEPFYGHHSISLDVERPNLWIYRDFKIEQQLKYVSVDTLMRNLIRRNQNPADHRDMPRVLEDQYSTRFIASTSPDQQILGTLKVESLKKWIERAVKINFFDISPNHAFVYDESMGDIDLAIDNRMQSFIQEMNDSENALDPRGEKVIGQDLEALKDRKIQFPMLQKFIHEQTQRILKNMHIPPDVSDVNLTYVVSSGVKPTIIRD